MKFMINKSVTETLSLKISWLLILITTVWKLLILEQQRILSWILKDLAMAQLDEDFSRTMLALLNICHQNVLITSIQIIRLMYIVLQEFCILCALDFLLTFSLQSIWFLKKNLIKFSRFFMIFFLIKKLKIWYLIWCSLNLRIDQVFSKY